MSYQCGETGENTRTTMNLISIHPYNFYTDEDLKWDNPL
jgi:hypothetical protein